MKTTTIQRLFVSPIIRVLGKITIALACVLALFAPKAYAQKQANIWYLGTKAGIDFSGTDPVALGDGKLFNHVEGLSTICDKNGSLLFYTEGIWVFNRKHNRMPNGRDLLGHSSSSQSALIIPDPTNSSLYYIFTTGEKGKEALCYSIVDMAKDDGLGDLTSKNVRLLEHATEKLAAVLHYDQQSVWLVGHAWNSNKFYAWQIKGNGEISPPIVSAIGSLHGPDQYRAMGTMKFSPNGKHIAVAVGKERDDWNSFVEIFDFDTKTGLIQNPQKIEGFNIHNGAYGLEFSPNSKLLYISELDAGAENGGLYQVPMPAKSGLIDKLGIKLGMGSEFATLQNAPNGKIYLASTNAVMVINKPNVSGVGCDFAHSNLVFPNGSSEGGLPNYIASYFMDPITITAQGNCTAQLVNFDFTTTIKNIDSVTWDFGDPASLTANSSKSIKATHLYQKTGTYTVTVKIHAEGGVKIGTYEHVVYSSPVVNLGNDVTLLYKETLTLNATNASSTYKWSTGDSTPSYVVTQPGMYWVEITNSVGCTVADTITVNYDQPINVKLPSDTTICGGQKIVLDVYQEGLKYKWSTGSHSPSITVTAAGIYSVEITNFFNNRTVVETITITDQVFNPITNVSDMVLCGPEMITLMPQGAKGTEKYCWYDDKMNKIHTGDGRLTVKGDRNLIYYVSISTPFCESELKRIAITLKKPKAVIFYNDKLVNVSEGIQLSASGGVKYEWYPHINMDNPAVPNPIVKPMDDQTYHVIVSNEAGCKDTAYVAIRVSKMLIVPNAFTPNGDRINDTWVIKNIDRYPQVLLEVYNRYGVKVKSLSRYQNDWDGKADNGSDLPIGAYYYKITYQDKTSTSGSVTILR